MATYLRTSTVERLYSESEVLRLMDADLRYKSFRENYPNRNVDWFLAALKFTLIVLQFYYEVFGKEEKPIIKKIQKLITFFSLLKDYERTIAG